MHKIVPVLVIMLSGCAQHNADRVSIDFEPMYPQEMPLVETNTVFGHQEIDKYKSGNSVVL